MKISLPSAFLSPAARKLHGLIEPRPPQTELLLAEIAAQLQRLDVADAIALGFSFAATTDHTGDRVIHTSSSGRPAGILTLMLSPQGRHRALQWHEAATDRLRLWIDAVELALPSDGAGNRLISPAGQWIGERLFAAQVQAIDHPHQDWSKVPGNGTVFGLLVCDAANARQRLVLPRHDEVWTSPLLRVEGPCVRLYADDAALEADNPAHEWDLDTP